MKTKVIYYRIDTSKPETISKQMCEQNKLQKWEWQLQEVIKDHGHTIDLLQASLIIATYPDKYNYEKYLERSFNECYQELGI